MERLSGRIQLFDPRHRSQDDARWGSFLHHLPSVERMSSPHAPLGTRLTLLITPVGVTPGRFSRPDITAEPAPTACRHT